MRVTRNQLRQIIIENLLLEDALVTQASLNTVANLLAKGNPTQVANALHTLADASRTPAGQVRVGQALNQLAITQKLSPQNMNSILRAAHMGSFGEKAAQGARALRWNLRIGSAASEAIKAGTWAPRAVSDFSAVGRAAAGGIRTTQGAVRAIMKAPEAANAVRQVGSSVVRSGQALTRVPQGSQLVTTAANAVTASPVPEVAANAGKLAKFLKFVGPVSFALLILDTTNVLGSLFTDGELRVPGTGGLIKWKIGIGINDMKTPWGQLTYRRKRLGMPPAKPSDFNDEYKNVIATIIWNQKNEGEGGAYAKEWTQTAIREDLIDIAAWKAYLEPWRQAEARIQEAERTILAEDEEIDESEFEGEGSIASILQGAESDAEDATETQARSSTGDQETNTATTSTQRNTSLSNKISKVQRLIGMRPDGEWSRDVNMKLGAFAVAASFSDDKKAKTTPENLEWWKDWKNSAPKIKKITVGGRNMTFGSGGNPPLKGNIDSLIKVLEFIKESRESMNENLSRGSLIRKRYWGRY